MDDAGARKVSVSMKNAITSNNYHDHALGKTVKQLEVERDLKMLSLQIQKDKVRFSTSPKLRAKKATRIQSRQEPVVDETDLMEETEAIKTQRKLNLTKTHEPQFLPLIRSHSARTRRMGTVLQNPLITHSSPPSPKSIHKSSIGSKLGHDERKSPSSSRRHVISSPVLTAKFPEGLCEADATIVHRGLSIRPLLSMSTLKQPNKQRQHEEKATRAVFSRLYQVQPKPKKSVAELMESKTDSSPKLDRRRRSISMPDFLDVMDDLQNCRYLRQNFTDNQSQN